MISPLISCLGLIKFLSYYNKMMNIKYWVLKVALHCVPSKTYLVLFNWLSLCCCAEAARDWEGEGGSLGPWADESGQEGGGAGEERERDAEREEDSAEPVQHATGQGAASTVRMDKHTPHMHTHTCMHAHAHMHAHTRTRTHTQSHTHTCTYTHTHTKTHAYSHTVTTSHTHAHTHTRAHTHTCTYTHAHTYTHWHTHTLSLYGALMENNQSYITIL